MAQDPRSTKSREDRVAEQLRANLLRRKEQARSRRKGEADQRPEGVALPSGETGEATVDTNRGKEPLP